MLSRLGQQGEAEAVREVRKRYGSMGPPTTTQDSILSPHSILLATHLAGQRRSLAIIGFLVHLP